MQTETLQKNITYDELLDAVEVQMHENGLVKVKIIHEFTPGLYTRSMVNVPPNTWLLSLIHKQEHQFIMSKGKIIVFTEEDGMKMIVAPFLGKTMPDTRRFARTADYVTWTSIHPTPIQPKNKSKKAIKEAIKLVESELYENRENLLLIKAKGELCQH